MKPESPNKRGHQGPTPPKTGKEPHQALNLKARNDGQNNITKSQREKDL